ncbi:hypothetical protein [Edaphovirga cremea]
MPDMGRDYHVVPGVMRIEFQRHTIFYTVRYRYSDCAYFAPTDES